IKRLICRSRLLGKRGSMRMRLLLFSTTRKVRLRRPVRRLYRLYRRSGHERPSVAAWGGTTPPSSPPHGRTEPTMLPSDPLGLLPPEHAVGSQHEHSEKQQIAGNIAKTTTQVGIGVPCSQT